MNLSKIGSRAFRGCSSLTSIILPLSIRQIGFDAFSNCSSLSRIAIPHTISELEDEDVFSGCESLKEISYGGSKSDWEMLLHSKTLTVEHKDGSLHTPRVIFLELNKKKEKMQNEV
jgi:hypothetical protein